jgi:hypothetical protein
VSPEAITGRFGVGTQSIESSGTQSMTNSAGWLRIDPAKPGAIEGLCSDLAHSTFAEQVDLFADPRWVAALADQDEKQAA